MSKSIIETKPEKLTEMKQPIELTDDLLEDVEGGTTAPKSPDAPVYVDEEGLYRYLN